MSAKIVQLRRDRKDRNATSGSGRPLDASRLSVRQAMGVLPVTVFRKSLVYRCCIRSVIQGWSQC
jgi:hypothetical protein